MGDHRSTVVYLLRLSLYLLSLSFSFQQPQVQFQELRALLELRSSLGIRAKEWPIKENPCINWIGIDCSLNGSVTGINISRFKRSRIGSQNPQFSVDSLQNLTNLERFNASGFVLPGSIPEWLGFEVNALQVLDLSSCGITGPIPSSIGNLTDLTSLYLADNKLTGSIPSSLSRLSKLSVLDLARNLLTGTLYMDFSSLRNLTLLDFSSNYLAGAIPRSIGTLPMLKVLNFSRNSFTSSIPGELGGLGSLIDLDLSANWLTGSIPQGLQGLRSLEKMFIQKNSLSGELPGNLFQFLTQLQVLVMDHNNITGDLPGILWSMPRLHFFDASSNNFIGTLPNIDSNNTVNASVFNISQNMLYGNITLVIKRYSVIDLSGNYLQGNIPDYAISHVGYNTNCLRNVSNQRNITECSSFYAENGLSFDNFGAGPTTKNSDKNTRVIILAAVLGGVGFIVLVGLIVLLCCLCKRKKGATTERETELGPVEPVGPESGTSPSPGPGGPLNFLSLTYQQILDAIVGGFSDENLVKHGHSGDLFRGMLEGRIPVVIKKLLESVKKGGYMVELDFFGKISHPRIVPLLGYCLENEDEKFLVYKYMPNGDLSTSLFWDSNPDEERLQSLDWITRLKIAIGAAEALCYLHHDCTPPLVHRDVQASSILLDDKFEVRLGSLSEVCAQEGDTHQSRLTRLLRLPSSDQGSSGTPNATCAYDVYCFGKVLLELVTGKLGMSAADEPTVKEWLDTTLPNVSIYEKELVTNIIDPSLIIDEDLLEEVWAMAIVARSCLNPKPNRRPLMRYILKALENPLKVVREEQQISSNRLRATSSRGSWNAAIFGSWRQSSSNLTAVHVGGPSGHSGPSGPSFKKSATSGSNGEGGHSSSTRRYSNEIVPEPLDEDEIVEVPN